MVRDRKWGVEKERVGQRGKKFTVIKEDKKVAKKIWKFFRLKSLVSIIPILFALLESKEKWNNKLEMFK